MSLKEKIALADLVKKVQRGILTEEQGKARFKEITGRDPDESIDEQQDADLVNHLDALAKTVPAKPAASKKKPVEKKVVTDPQAETQEPNNQDDSQQPENDQDENQLTEVTQHPERIDTQRTIQVSQEA
ncbi:hypothetical protein [Dyadobacter diqingensis]|uniref:hypothetical protein n=1 Tax=Dyadobacter diqingensis TaxID=2938121 RepID=UPI0020C4416E|nr:hypothetical protein [Dyadobacter diqingensis]